MRRAVRATLRIEGAPDAEVSILLADDATVQQLNRDFRGQDRPTDVLSFAQREGGAPATNRRVARPGAELLGDVVISVETAQRQAREQNHSLGDELAHLAVHGALHLLGYDDETERGAETMRRRERAALEAAGMGAAGRSEVRRPQ